ncbi:Fe3+/spermidine/putrescine ABC transporter ATP-binding protein [Methylopila jiangsuensis]|uniref:Fe3+/spermidine/putrescine ABC transporter ATP-binding protein n=1 Tax=Methylopila jiangsuensis TaxID=586230 RepID=A0A9W6N4X6_9HYPH|nr:ABC transporter ATP-binding protein [Methylopila jiangsuensis]MDR6284824.1 spermidine/putrescine transport system ATP-binding protein [Methylopila jiangsuensis]GLK77785.1 Fe3+/spermidine/putrescine ABC transporter ATP-binding protein [Methylopila jiangsuensis]
MTATATALPAAPATPAPVPPAADAKPILQLVGVRKTFGSFAAVDGIDLDIREGEFLTLVGPSGSGKTTLLRMLAGMEAPSEGVLSLRGVRINDTPSSERPTCLVFQSLALFPHMTVGANIEFPLKAKGVAAGARKERALALLDLVRLPRSYYGKNVMQCSGGERQRVAIARALSHDPEILFFDEPLSALDYKLRKVMEKELKDLHRASGKTFVYITHSLEEAMVMSDRIGVMQAGRLVQVGAPEEIYSRPATRFVAEFMGEVNVIEARRAGGVWRAEGIGELKLIPPPELEGADAVAVVVRPEFLRFVDGDADNRLTGEVFNEYALGSRIQYQVRAGAKTYLLELSRAKAWRGEPGQAATIGWDARDAIVAPLA